MAAALLGRCHAGSDAPLCAVKRRLTLQFPREAVHQPITYRLAVDYDVASRIIRAQVAPNQRGTLVVELSGDIDELDAAQEWLMSLGLTISSRLERSRSTLSAASTAASVQAFAPVAP